ncbi:MAG: CBS domain-containing protein [Proteobacteria bacterium]|nr:CBS domain-containing protein [Pseudomonadota bacterium]
MRSITVRELMVPIGEYATVPQEADLYEAVLALEEAQKTVDPQKHKHRAILVLDDRQKVVGKISIFRVLIALEPKYRQLDAESVLTGSGFSPKMIEDMLKDNTLWNEPMEFICNRAAQFKVTDFMETPTDEVFVDENTLLGAAIHQMVMQKAHSLLVTRGDEVVGILRLSDVFTAICDRIKIRER